MVTSGALSISRTIVPVLQSITDLACVLIWMNGLFEFRYGLVEAKNEVPE